MASVSPPEPIVPGGWVRAHRSRVHLVDCRVDLDDPAGARRAYREAHVTGAGFLDLATDLSGPHGPGRHPLPDPEAFGAAARRAGIRSDVPVIAYDQDMAGGAARLWWLLRHWGTHDVAVLDGGLEAWDGPLTAGEEDIPAGDWRPGAPRTDDVIDRAELRAGLHRSDRVLLDARARPRYRGDHEPRDPVAGHIPGARNVPFDTATLPRDLADRADELIAYCGSGVTACVLLLRLAAQGRHDARLYPGSWSDWSAHGLPAATGDDAEGDGREPG